jgi:hypothetical protein
MEDVRAHLGDAQSLGGRRPVAGCPNRRLDEASIDCARYREIDFVLSKADALMELVRSGEQDEAEFD